MHFEPLEFGKRLSLLRKSHGLTQEQLAEKLNISWDHLSKIERGKRTPSLDVIIAIACYFCVSTDYLLLGTGSEQGDNRRKLMDVISQLTEIANHLQN